MDRIQWFTQRGFNQDSIQRFRFGHTGSRFVIPLWGSTVLGTTALGYKLRLDPLYCDPEEVKYLNEAGSKLFVIRPRPTDTGPLVVCEGELDAYLLSQYGYDTITVSTGSQTLAAGISGELKKTNQSSTTRRILLAATDLDPAGDKAFAQLQALVPQVSRLRWNTGNDITDYITSLEEDARWYALKDLIEPHSYSQV
jgi:DNA primase